MVTQVPNTPIISSKTVFSPVIHSKNRNSAVGIKYTNKQLTLTIHATDVLG